jgi:hypothetical protein
MLASRVLQSAVAPGNATTINLVAPTTGWRSFVAAIGAGTVFYSIEDPATLEWEEGEGTVTAGAPDTLTRTTVLRNSLGTTARINFTGTVRVFNTLFAPTSVGRQVFFAANAAAARAAMDARMVYATAVASTSGSSIDFTGIPSGVRRVLALFSGVSTNGTNVPVIQVGTSGGVVATGYLGAHAIIDTTNAISNISSGFTMGGTNAANLHHGVLSLSWVTGNTWVGTLHGGLSNSALKFITTGSIALSGELDRVRFTTYSADTFDAGTVNIAWGF